MFLNIALLVVVLQVSTLSRGFFVIFSLICSFLSLVLARETKTMYNIFLLNLPLSVILNVITMYIKFILDVELS